MTEPDEALLWARDSAYQRALEMLDGDETEALAQIDHEDAEYVINWLAEAYRAGAAASEARVKALEGFLRRLREWDQMNPPMTGDHAAWAASIDALLKEADQ